MFEDQLAARLVDRLRERKQRIVFAESCTAGLIAAACGRIPGVSEVLAGSAVVYQIETKAAWLKVEEKLLTDPGPVSRIVSEQMAVGVLRATSHADIGVSVTGHLGPDAPDELDGKAWSTVALKTAEGKDRIFSKQLLLTPNPAEVSGMTGSGLEIRHARQFSAVRLVLEFCLDTVHRSAP